MTVGWSQATRFAGPEESPGFVLWQVGTAWRRLIEQVLACLGCLTRDGARVVQAAPGRPMRADTKTVPLLRRLLPA